VDTAGLRAVVTRRGRHGRDCLCGAL